jgi:hypothetical protein
LNRDAFGGPLEETQLAVRQLEHFGALVYAFRLKQGERGLEIGDREAKVIDADPTEPRAPRYRTAPGGGKSAAD